MNTMMRLRPAAPVRLAELQLQELEVQAAAQGLEGQVLGAANSTYLCKVFTVPKDAGGAAELQALIDFREWGVTGRDREIMRSHFSWPLHRVLEDATLETVGVLIPPAEPRFYFELDDGVHLREGQHLPRPTTVAGLFDVRCRLLVLADMAEGWDMLSRYELVYGDANSRNVVFATTGSPAAFFLDCDGIRRAGAQGGVFRAQPNWTDPFSGGASSLQSDNYLFALWVLRVLSSSMVPAPTAGFDPALLDPIARNSKPLLGLLRNALGAVGKRPGPGEFLPVLRSLAASA